MANTKKITKTIAAVMSFALAFGAAGNFSVRPFPTPTTASASYTNEDYYGLVELELKDAMINFVDLDSGYISVYVKSSKGYYNYQDEKKFLLNCINPDYHDPFADDFPETSYTNYYYTENGIVFKTYQQCLRESEILSGLSEYETVNIRFNVPKYYLRDYDSAEDFINNEDTFEPFCILSVRSPMDHLYGDINDDGVIDSFDVITYRKYVAGTLKTELTNDMFLNADINKDEVIDEDDLRQVIDFTLGKTSEFNSPAIGSIRLDNTVDVLASEGVKTDEKFAAAEMDFGVELLKKCYDKNTNLLISPVSISTALAMTANGADGETRKEMEKVLGGDLTLNQLNEYISYYASHLPQEQKEKAYIANSIWFKDIANFKVLDSFLETNKKFYNSEIYKTDFSPNTVKDINSWVNKNTRGMIPTLVKNEDMNDALRMMLINTLYFEAEWQRKYDDSHSSHFTDINGNVHDIDMLSSEEYLYYDLGNADAFKKPYKGNYSFVGILPHEDVDFNEYIEDLDSEKLLEGIKVSEDPSKFELHVSIPKFKYNYSKTLKDVLSEMGMPSAFDEDAADFSKINDQTVPFAEQLFISNVIHKTRIELTEKGTKAAAVTAVMMEATCAMPDEKKKIYITLNRPFVYMIVDENNVPAFIGAVTSLDK